MCLSPVLHEFLRIIHPVGCCVSGEPELRIICALHGNEMVGIEIVATFAEWLMSNYGQNSEVTWLVDNTRIHILLSANPDGRLASLKHLSELSTVYT